MGALTDLLSPEAMHRLDGMVLRSRYVVEGMRAGMHASPLKGVSVEFADHRQYVKGDNLRHLDWKVYGRTERYYVKQFEEETNLRVHVVLDGSGSMAYQSGKRPTKFRFACHVAAALGYLAIRQQDSLGLTIYDREIRVEVPARGGTRHLRAVIDCLLRHDPGGAADAGGALHALAEKVYRRGLIVMITDLLDDPGDIFHALAHFRKRMHDVSLIQVLDPCELELSIPRVAELVDMESGERLQLDPARARKEYKEALQGLIQGCRERCATLNVDYRLVSTEEGYEDFLHQYLAERRLMLT